MIASRVKFQSSYNHASSAVQQDSVAMRLKVAVGFIFGLLIGALISLAGAV